jgi:hypothetical protein
VKWVVQQWVTSGVRGRPGQPVDHASLERVLKGLRPQKGGSVGSGRASARGRGVAGAGKEGDEEERRLEAMEAMFATSLGEQSRALGRRAQGDRAQGRRQGRKGGQKKRKRGS